MAIQQFDAFGNYTGGYGLLDNQETEEERRRRLAKEASNTLVGKTEVETYADGSQTRTTTQEIPAAQPLGQGIQVAGPMDPAVFDRMIQAESGGQQFNRQGGVLTSPKGALGLGQVMPATAAQPGYGVPSIFELAERRGIAVPSRDPAGASQLLANPELNREFAQNYANAMNQRFGQQGGVAAYNAGPGRVERNMAANQGQLNAQALPGETQGYLDRVLGGVRRGAEAVVNAVIPSAQAATPAAAGPVDPAEARRRAALAQRPPLPGSAGSQAAADQVYQGAAAPVAPVAPPAAPTQPVAQAAPAPTPMVTSPVSDGFRRLADNQNNIAELSKIRENPNEPQIVRNGASRRMFQLLNAEVQKNNAEEQARDLAQRAAQGDVEASRIIANALSGRGGKKEEGSWLRYILLGYLSPQMANEEAMRLGYGNRTETRYDENGNAVSVEVRADGKPLRGVTEDGIPLSENQLVRYSGAVGGRKSFEMPQTLGTPVVKEVTNADGTTQQIGGIRMYDPQSRTTYVQVGSQRMPDVNWVTTGQAPGAVYGAAGARAQGTAAGEGYTPAPLPPRPGSAGAAPAQAAPAPAQAAPAPAQAAPAPAQPSAPAPVAGPAVPTVTTPAPTQAAPAPAPVTQPAGAVPPLTGPAAQKAAAEKRGKERDVVLKSNQEFGDALNKARQSGVTQRATIDRLQTAIDKNPTFWAIDTNSTVWRAFVDINSKESDRAEALNTFARNLTIPRTKRKEFDQVMNDYRNLQLNAITSSGLTASQTNTERESQRVIGTIGSLADRPEAAKATLEYAKAKIAYTEAKARAWNEARKKPDSDYIDFEIEFDRTQGEKIFADANKRMSDILGGQPGAGTGRTSSGNTFRRVQ